MCGEAGVGVRRVEGAPATSSTRRQTATATDERPVCVRKDGAEAFFAELLLRLGLRECHCGKVVICIRLVCTPTEAVI